MENNKDFRVAADPGLFFKGRPGDPRLGELVATEWPLVGVITRVCVIGAPDDLGVRLNRGRAGAAGGPAAIRRELYKMTPPMDGTYPVDPGLFSDGGDAVVGSSGDAILDSHHNAQRLCEIALNASRAVIALGGGNDYSLPHAKALREVAAATKDATGTIGIISIDPHLDVRERENSLPHSGTPYRDLIEGGTIDPRNLVQFGTRRNRNAANHYLYCRERSVVVREFSELRRQENTRHPDRPAVRLIDAFAQDLERLVSRCDAVMVSIDLDACRGLPGVSAPGAIGFSAEELCEIASTAGRHKKVRLFELVECAPELDPSGMTPRVAAEIAHAFMVSRIPLS
jgi:formimidoylglutamase